METTYCPNCMRVLENGAERRLCPNCGFDLAANPQPPSALPWHTMLHDRYRVGRVLGQGGFGITYIGFDTNLQCKVAIKEYYPRGVAVRDASRSHSLTWPDSQDVRGKESGCASFLREARKMARIGSVPGIVRVIDTFTENDTAYIIMDYLEGVTLRQYIRANGPMTFARCIELLHPLFGAIDELHTKGMIHRDISPDNIMIRDNGTVWLLDFGAAKDIADSAGGESSIVVARSGFSPSEQYSGSNIGPWTDVYALCATIYYCVSGRTLPDANARVQDDSIQWEPVRVPEDIRETIREGLSMRYSDRIQSVSELARRLDGAQVIPTADGGGDRWTGNETELVTDPGGDGGYSVSIDPFTEEAKKQRRKGLIIKISAAAAAALLLIGGAVFAVSQFGSNSAAEDPEESETAESTDAAEKESAEAVWANSEQVESYAPEASDAPASQSPPLPAPQPTASPTMAPTPQPTAAPTPQPTAAPASLIASGTCGANLTWRLDKLGVLTVSGTGQMTDFDMSTQPWKANRDDIVSVVIENGVSSLGDYVFYSHKNLTKVSFSNSVTRIGKYAFEYCPLTVLSLPDSLISIDNGAFFQCNSLTDVTIPANVSSIGFAPFGYCGSLKTISVSGGNTSYCSENGVLYNKRKTELVQYPGAGPSSFTVPESVTSIGHIAFGGNGSLASVTIAGSQVDIGDRAFQNCTALTTMTVRGGCSLGEFAFSGCSSLTHMTFQGHAPKISSSAFMNDTLTISYPAGDSTWEELFKSYFNNNITWKAN